MAYTGTQQVVIADSNNEVLMFGHADFANNPRYDSDHMSIIENNFVFTSLVRKTKWYWTGSTFTEGSATPTEEYEDKDDFIGSTISPWTATIFGGLSSVSMVGIAGGGVQLRAGNVTNHYAQIDKNGVKNIGPSYGCYAEARLISYDTTNVELHFGLLISGLTTAIRLWHAGANWQATCIDGGTPTTEDTGVSSSVTLPKVFSIECKSTWVEFCIGGERVAIIDDIPSGLAEPYAYIKATAGGATKDVVIDHIAFRGFKI